MRVECKGWAKRGDEDETTVVHLILGKIATVEATIPLAETKGIAKEIRTISSGLASFHIEFKEYQPVSIDKVRIEL
jgi:translation elongation factor EF-G